MPALVLVPFHEEILGQLSSLGPVRRTDVMTLGLIIVGKWSADTKDDEISEMILENLGFIMRDGSGKSVPSPRFEPRPNSRDRLLETVNRVTGRNFKTLPSTGVRKTMETFSLAEIEIALRELVMDEWHREKIKKISIEYILRATTIDNWLNVAREKNPMRVTNQLNQEPIVEI